MTSKTQFDDIDTASVALLDIYAQARKKNQNTVLATLDYFQQSFVRNANADPKYRGRVIEPTVMARMLVENRKMKDEFPFMLPWSVMLLALVLYMTILAADRVNIMFDITSAVVCVLVLVQCITQFMRRENMGRKSESDYLQLQEDFNVSVILKQFGAALDCLNGLLTTGMLTPLPWNSSCIEGAELKATQKKALLALRAQAHEVLDRWEFMGNDGTLVDDVKAVRRFHQLFRLISVIGVNEIELYSTYSGKMEVQKMEWVTEILRKLDQLEKGNKPIQLQPAAA